MASKWQRLWAWFDKVISRLFYLDCNYIEPGRNGSSVELRFYYNFGPWMAVVHSNRVVEIGRRFEVIHLYDQQNRLLLRKRRCKMLETGDKLIFGHVPGDPFDGSEPLNVYNDYEKGKVIIVRDGFKRNTG